MIVALVKRFLLSFIVAVLLHLMTDVALWILFLLTVSLILVWEWYRD